MQNNVGIFFKSARSDPVTNLSRLWLSSSSTAVAVTFSVGMEAKKFLLVLIIHVAASSPFSLLFKDVNFEVNGGDKRLEL